MDGVALLTEMRRRYPAVARIILSGETVQHDVMRCLSVAHQSLSKPCDPSDLVAAVRRACDLQDRLHNLELRQTLGRVGSLPSPPAAILELRAVIERDDAEIAEVDGVISTDVGMAAKVLQLVNSSFFGLARHVTEVRDALAYLGLNLVHDLVVATEVFRSAEVASGLPGNVVERLRAHSTAVSQTASELARRTSLHQQALVAGLLHDIGWLVLAAQAPERLQAVAAGTGEGRSLEDVEQEVLGASHAEVGAYLLSLWGLPTTIVEAVAHHHDAESMPHREFDLPHLVYLADWLAHDQGQGLDEIEASLARPDQAYLDELGAAEPLARAQAALAPVAPSCPPA
jgi:putative nucleotidyltransferase with HDIG domain